jgi:hypothetical protein
MQAARCQGKRSGLTVCRGMVHFFMPDARNPVCPLLHFSSPFFFIDGLLGLDIESLSLSMMLVKLVMQPFPFLHLRSLA